MKYRITIEAVPTNPGFGEIVSEPPIVLEADTMQFQLENGLTYAYLNGKRTVESNGQRRLVIKGWSGCASWDSFTTEFPHEFTSI